MFLKSMCVSAMESNGEQIRRRKSRTDLEPALDDLPQFLALIIARVLYFETTTLGGDLLSGEWPSSVSPSRVRPPRFHGGHVGMELSIFMLEVRHRHGLCKGLVIRHGWCE